MEPSALLNHFGVSTSDSDSENDGGGLCNAAYTNPSSGYTSIDDIINTTGTDDPMADDDSTFFEYSMTDVYASTTDTPLDITLYKIDSFDNLCKYTQCIFLDCQFHIVFYVCFITQYTWFWCVMFCILVQEAYFTNME